MPPAEATMTTSLTYTLRSFLVRLAVTVAIVFFFVLLSRAENPNYVAGSSYFDSSMTGQPLVWPGGVITYYTDQGDLSPILPNASANIFVANSFSQWTAVPTAALAITSGGQLAEDVNGTNVYVNPNGTITMPADIQPSATGTPVGVVYDYDGTVTDALLGAGAGDSSQCFFNAVYGGDDNFGALGTYQHALIVINGQCALYDSQLVDVEYRLVRVIGNVLGLGWSQVNPNVLTGNPPPTPADYLGFPVMHYTDPIGCVPITICYANPYQLASDDVSSVSVLYPVTPQNQSDFSGSQLFAATTGSIYGTVWFVDTSGNPTQPMQGVNVVARQIDLSTGQPSGQYAVSSVSGYLFTGNAGNPVTGFTDALGDPFSQWGSNSQTVEGLFQIAGLPVPTGASALYQLTVEPLDPTWSVGVGPYAPYQVTPSGLPQPVTVTVSAGEDVDQDILMSGSAQPVPPLSSSLTWTAPASLPVAGDWMGSLSGYGDVSYFLLPAQANRTLSIAVTALDESGVASESKVQPVIGIWPATDPQGAAPPASTPSPFNAPTFGMTQLNAQINASEDFLIGIADLRGDGRPDYHFHAQVLYANTVSPARVGVGGGAVTIQGTGFFQGLTTTVGTTAATPLSVNAGQMILAAPPFPDGPQSITLTDPTTGNFSIMTNALTYGAAATDTLLLLSGLNPSTPVGTQATNPVSVQVLASDGVTPVAGATIGWAATNNLQLSACNSTPSCSVTTDQDGDASTWLIPATPGVSTITATLAPGVYNPSQSVSATLDATESPADIGTLTPYLWIAQGATVSTPLTVRLLNNGVPQNNVKLNFMVATGSATLSAPTATTNTAGYATDTLSLSQFNTGVEIDACVAQGNSPCVEIYANPVPLSQLNLEPVSGAGQVSTDQRFLPVSVRVVDSFTPPHPVLGASVAFLITVLRPGGSPTTGGGETNPTNPAMPVILSVSQSTSTSDIYGLASVTPSSGKFSAPLEVDVAITAGTSASINDALQLLPAPTNGNDSSGTAAFADGDHTRDKVTQRRNFP
jgi:hypothetical protein